MVERDGVTNIEEIIHHRSLARAIVQSIEMGLEQANVHLSGKSAWEVFQHSLGAAIRDIEVHPRGKLFRRLLEYGPPNPDEPKLLASDGETVLSEPECGECVQFIFSHMVNRFKGDLAELLSIAPCIRLVEQLQQEGQFPANIGLYFGETVEERRWITAGKSPRWGGFGKGADGLLVEKVSTVPQNGSHDIHVLGLVEVKSMSKPETQLLSQLNQHTRRLSGGLRLEGIEWQAENVVCRNPFLIMVFPATWKLSREWQRQDTQNGWELVMPEPAEPPIGVTIEQSPRGHWIITLDWSKEALEQAAYEMTFWYMSQVGKAIFANKPLPAEWEGMSPEEAGYNSIKMMLYSVILRYISRKQSQLAIKLYNTYCFGYPLAMEAADMLWPEDFQAGDG